jgi:hypothetical protein
MLSRKCRSRAWHGVGARPRRRHRGAATPSSGPVSWSWPQGRLLRTRASYVGVWARGPRGEARRRPPHGRAPPRRSAARASASPSGSHSAARACSWSHATASPQALDAAIRSMADSVRAWGRDGNIPASNIAPSTAESKCVSPVAQRLMVSTPAQRHRTGPPGAQLHGGAPARPLCGRPPGRLGRSRTPQARRSGALRVEGDPAWRFNGWTTFSSL